MAHWRTAFDNETMTAGDLMGRGDVVATIEKVVKGTVKAKGKPKKLLMLKLSGFPLPFGANPTNCSTIGRIHGNDFDGWAGKRITLYVDMVDAPDPLDGRRSIKTEAIRVRPTAPTGGDSPAKEPPRDLTPDEAAQVRACCEAIEAATTPEAIEQAIAPHRAALKAIGGRAAVIVAGAKHDRLATIAADAQEPAA